MSQIAADGNVAGGGGKKKMAILLEWGLCEGGIREGRSGVKWYRIWGMRWGDGRVV